MTHEEIISLLLSDPDSLKKKRPFTRGVERSARDHWGKRYVEVGEMIEAYLPNEKKTIVTQEQFKRELDPFCHDVLFNDNLPSICVKISDNDYRDIKFDRMPVPIQKLIKNEQVIYLTAHDMQFTLSETDPTEVQQKNYITIKRYWEERNQDGMKNKMVDTQLSFGDAGLLYYFDYKGRIKSRILSYDDGFVLCPHNDENGDRALESVYYVDDDVEYIDSYDDTYMYRYTRSVESTDTSTDTTKSIIKGWLWHTPVKHGFQEIPLITKRGNVAWNDIQCMVDTYEEQFNIFNAIQRRLGWGLLYIKGKFKDEAKKIAGSVILNDTSPERNGDAKFLTPPSPDGMIDTLKELLKNIQLGARTTFILPEDIKMSGDVSGLAVHMTKELDIQNAMNNVIGWQNVASKMIRLFKYGLAKELVKKGLNPNAVTEFEELNMTAKFKVWRPFNETEYNNMVINLAGAGLISKETGIEVNTLRKPDEKSRIQKEEEERRKDAEASAPQVSTLNSVGDDVQISQTDKTE